MGHIQKGYSMKRNFALIVFVLTCIAVIAIHLGSPTESGALFHILINFFMFVIPASAGVLLLLYGAAVIVAQIFHLSVGKLLRFVCTFFPLPVSIACGILMKIGLIDGSLAISCICISVPLTLLVWWRK